MLAAPTAYADPNHVVQFYDNDAGAREAVVDFLRRGLCAGEPVVVIATELHRRMFVDALHVQGIDTTAHIERGDLVVLDARATLDALMLDGRPNAELFDTVVGGVMERMTAARPRARVHAYGEMVDLLCRAGDADGALALEELWNGLATRYQFALFCAYVMEGLLPTSEQARARVAALTAR
jgi:hypothetical protein